MSSQADKERVRDANDIVDVVSGFVNLKQTGKSFKGLCPFHKEKTASFHVFPDRQNFKCFGCGAGGDVYEFLMKAEGKTFPETLQMLAQRAHIELERGVRPVNDEEDKLKRKIASVCQWAMERFQQALYQSEPGKKAVVYVQERKISEALQKQFELGFAPPGWDNLLRAGNRDHFSEEILEKAGLILVREDEKKRYDRFRNRVMFPIFDLQGKPVAFGGRMIGPGEPKYLNSPETLIFHKGEMLYALNWARDAARHTKRFVLVEGYMDVIACHGAGVTECVASLGTALSPAQARLLKRYAPKVILLYDMDAAGVTATIRAFEILHQAGLQVEVVTLPDAKDPDEFIQKQGVAAFSKRLEAGLSMPAFVLDVACRRNNTDTVDGKIAVIKETGQIIVQYPHDGIERSDYIHLVAERLHLLDTQVQAEMARVVKGLVRRRVFESEEEPGISGGVLHARKAIEEEQILVTLLQFPLMVEAFREKIDPELFRVPEFKRLLQKIMQAPVADPDDSEAWFLEFHKRLPEEMAALAARLVAIDKGTEEPQKVLQDCLGRLRIAVLQDRLTGIQIKIKEVEKQGDMETFKLLAQEKKETAAELKIYGVIWKGER
ncbi:DNA primase [bacterium]|nr:DNA primase [bacterium]